MKHKKLQSTKTGCKRKKVPSDVSPSTSLPPLVEGHLRCFLRVTISRILWMISKPPVAAVFRLRWWGESSNGTHFYPRDGSRVEQKGVKTTARFAIRCGPKQFTSYLTDMGTLVLEALSKPDHLPIGRVQVPGIARLSLHHSISGFYTLVSPTTEKLGELQVSLAVEPLAEAHGSSSSVPAVDMSADVPLPALGLMAKPVSHSDQQEALLSSHHLSAGSIKEVRSANSVNTPRGKDHLYFQEKISSQKGVQSSETEPEVLGSLRPLSNRLGHTAVQESPQRHDASHENSTDILSVLLERGNRLRDAMVVSCLKSDLDSKFVLKDTPLPVPKENVGTLPVLPSLAPSGKLLQDALHCDPGFSYAQRGLLLPEVPSHDWAPDMESRAIELLLGSSSVSALPVWDGEVSPIEILSGASSVCGDSDLGDPQYDQSLLESLFYKAPKLDSSQSEEEGTFSRKKQQKGTSVKEPVTEKLRKPFSKTFNSLEKEEESTEAETIPSLSVEQITFLSQVETARLVIHTLKVPTKAGWSGSLKNPSQGKQPFPNRKCTYFVEYLFPVASTSHSVSPLSTKLTRAASCKVAEGVINFQHQCVFPVQFDSSVIKHWWNTDLKFIIYLRKGSEKKPLPIGKAFLPLRSVLLLGMQPSKATALPVQGLEDGDGGVQAKPDLGPLKVLLELELGKQSSSRAPLQLLSSPDRKMAQLPKGHSENQLQGATLAQNSEPVASNVQEEMKITSMLGTQKEVHHPPSNGSPIGWLPNQPQQCSQKGPGLLLHILLMVPDGKDLSCDPGRLPNVYLSCKLFVSEEATRSAVSWGQTHPTFNFIQVAPVALTSKLLERLKNNMMVIEVWQKRGGSEQDRPLGLVKLPLHQFYMSFRDPKISQLLLQAQYPIVGVDSYMPVLDISSGSCHGHLRVLLAMGLAEQIASLQRIRDSELCSVSHTTRPPHLLDPTPQPESKVKVSNSQDMTEHVFEVRVQRVKGLMPLQTTVWGEADCYVQYSFPAQREDVAWDLDLRFPESGMSLRVFRTATTLCTPDPVFDHTESHVLVAPSAIPVQRLLLGSFCSQGTDARGGIQFEVWCRYYYPNVREQLVANCMLPLAKLCAMVTMQRADQPDTKVFSLPLVPRTENLAGHQPQPSGLMDVCVHYMHRPMRAGWSRGGAVAPRVVMLAVQVHRAAGLQAAAQAAARMDDTFQYYADTGVNSYVTMDISFLPERERRSTRMVAQSFYPEFEHHSEFPCNLVIHKPHGGTCSLAELLDGATAVFTLRHRYSRRMLEGPATRDTVLGIVTVQLADLVRKRAGVCGWFSLSLPQDAEKLPAHRSAVGGLEISINFAHHSDRERVIKAARGLGWELDMEGVEGHDSEDDLREGKVWQEKAPILSVVISVPKLWLPLHCLQMPGHQSLKRSTYCYIRYKLYEGKAVCSSLQHPSLEEEEPGGSTVATATFESGRPVELRVTPALCWYLQEERLELQVWVAFGKHQKPRPHSTDRLIGSAYVDLSSLANNAQKNRTITGVYPLFRRSAANLSGAALRVHIGTVSSGQGTSHPLEPVSVVESGDESSNQGEEGEEEEHHHLSATLHTPRHQEKPEVSSDAPSPEALIDTVNTFTASITVERAMHLSLKGCPLADRTGVTPSCCVSYSTADATSLVTTPVVEDSNCPLWDHRHECRLPKQILVDPQQTLVFKVWHKGDLERVIGFASVDLSPLLAGFQSVCGWYNITDFSGQCQGQLKVSISPLENVQDLRGQRQLTKVDTLKDSAALSEVSPLYCTSAMYSAFPTHISRYPEQRISTSPELPGAVFSGSSDNRHKEHVTNIRMFHESLRASEGVPHDGGSEDCCPSSSLLFSALRKNLSELDDMQRYFSHKLCTPTFPSQSEPDCQHQRERCRVSEGELSHLLLKSSLLAGEVNSLITNLHEHNPQGSHSIPRDPVPTENQSVPEEESETAQALQPLDAPESVENETSPPPSPVLESGEPDDASMIVEKVHSDGEEEDQASIREEEEEEEEYEETVIEPRQLNEISSLTDKTSPWTSLFSDPDLSSLGSLELSEEQPAVLSVAHQENAPESSIQQGGHECYTYAESMAEESSAIKTLQLDHPSESEEIGSKYLVDRSEDLEKTSMLHVSKHLMHLTDSCQPESSFKEAQLPDPGKIPNFFLTSEQMEASMRALCLAPVFPSADSDTTETTARPVMSILRAPRPRLNISSKKKEETKRIANIFASKFSDTK